MQETKLKLTLKDKNLITIDSYFVTGLIEAEGSFYVIKFNDTRAKSESNVGLRFKLTMLTNEIDLLNKVKTFFGCDIISIDKHGTLNFEVKDIKFLNEFIIPHFNNYPLRGTNYLYFIS